MVNLIMKLLLFFVCCVFCSLKNLFLTRGVQSSKSKQEEIACNRAGQANAVPLGPSKNNNSYANKAMSLRSPAPFV